jgi:polar amino acid transport system permease protein
MLVELDFSAVFAEWPWLVRGVAWTLGLTAVSAVLGVALGIACAWARTQTTGLWRMLSTVYVEAIRNTPFIVQLFFVFFGLPAAGVKLSPETASVLAMVVNLGAYAAEIIRSGIVAIPKGQVEAAISLALTRLQTFVHVVLPPALRTVWPALVSQIIIVMLGSAVCGQISTQELSYAANLIQSRNFRAFESFIVATALYLALSILVRAVLNWLGPRFLFGGRRG